MVRHLVIAGVVGCGWAVPVAGQTVGTIVGSVTSDEGIGIAGAIVTLAPLRLIEYTDPAGLFAFRDLPPGEYAVTMNLGSFQSSAEGLLLAAGQTLTVAKMLPRDFRISAAGTVSAASRVQEQRVEAPAAVSVVDAKTIALEGGAGQLPALLQFTAGAEYTQSGVYNIEFNARGFNGALTRRVQVLVDGRDLAAPESKNQEWLSVGFLAPELETIELVRGPAAALYGANSINGVMAMTTKTPRGSPGGRARVTMGELDSFIGDVRWAGAIGGGWYTKLLLNHTRSGSFTRSRTEQTEYEGLPLDVVPAVVDADATSAQVRFDRYFGADARQLVLESGFSQSGGGTYLSQAGRVSIVDSKRSWTRVSLNTARWTTQAYLNTRYADQRSLFAPVQFPTATVQFKAEARGNQHFAQARGRAVFGGSYLEEHVDSTDSAGAQTLYQRAVTTREGALFGQVDYDLTPHLTAIGALRWDESTLYPAQLSPRAAITYRPVAGHGFRASFNRGFQVGNYTELFLSVPLAPPADLSGIESALAPMLGDVALGLGAVPILAIGNPELNVERVQSIEAGYTGTFGGRAQVGVSVYRNRMRDFISDLLPGINPAYPPYQAPASLPEPGRTLIEATLNAALPGLTNLADGRPRIVYSNANVGLVTSRGVEVEGQVRPRPDWMMHASYTWFDFTVIEAAPGVDPKPNAPAHRVGFGVTYTGPRLAASFNHRWVDAFPWASGVFVGHVPAYHVSDLNASFTLTDHWQVGANISNVFDQRHYEMFGGDILRRRALSHLTVTW